MKNLWKYLGGAVALGYTGGKVADFIRGNMTAQTGFLKDVFGGIADIASTPRDIYDVITGQGYNYLTGQKGVNFSDVTSGLKKAVGWNNGLGKQIVTIGYDVAGKPILQEITGIGGTPDNMKAGRRGGQQIVHKAQPQINVGGTMANIQAPGKVTPYDPNRAASNFLKLAHSDKYLPEIHGQAVGRVGTIGETIALKDAAITVTKPSFRRTYSA